MAWAVYLNETSLASIGVYVMRINSHTSGPSRSYPTVALPGRQGVVLNADPEMGARTLSIQATIATSAATIAARATAEDQLKALAYAGAVAIGVDDDINAPRRIIGVCQGCDISQRSHPVDAVASDVTLTFLCPDPTWADVVGQVIGFSSTLSPVPVGTAPSGGIVRLSAPVWSANVTNPVLTYRNAAGVVVKSLTFNTTLTAGTDYLEIDLDRQTVVEYQSGVVRNAIGDITDGAFFALDPMDGDPLNASYPSLEVTSSAGTPSGQYLGTRRWL